MVYSNDFVAEKRGGERVELIGYAVTFIDIHVNSSVLISDVSKDGLRLSRVPRKLAYKETPTKITVSGNLLSGGHQLTIMPCWRKRNALFWDVGFYIHNPPVYWKKFFRIIKIRNRQASI